MELSQYYEEIYRKHPPLSKEEEQVLLGEYFDPDVSPTRKKVVRDRLINANLRYVFKKAKKYAKGNADQLEELIAVGNEGLIVGLDKYDPNSGVRLLTYSGWWVMQRQLKEMSRWRLVSLPTQKQQLAAKIKRYMDSCERHPPLLDLQKEFPNVPVKDLNELSQTQYLTFYFEEMNPTDMPEDNPFELVEQDNMEAYIMGKLKELPQRDCHIAIMLFGIEDGVEKRPLEIVEILNDPEVTAEYVRDVRKRVYQILESDPNLKE